MRWNHGIQSAAEKASKSYQEPSYSLEKKRVAELAPTLLNECVNGNRRTLRSLIPEDMEFEVRLDEDILTIMGDKTQIEQIILINLNNQCHRDSHAGRASVNPQPYLPSI